MSELNVKPILRQFLLSITGNDIMQTNNDNYDCLDRFIESDRFQVALKQANVVDTGERQLTIPDVMVLLPDKDILVSELYSRVYNAEYKRRHVMKSTLQDCYYSGYLDCYDELAGNKP